MAFNYRPIALTASRLLEQFGSPVVFERSQTTHFPVTGEHVEGTPLSWGGNGVKLTRYKGIVLDNYDDSFRAGLVTGQSALFIVQGADMEYAPQAGDTLIAGSRWRVVGASELNPASGEEAVIYYLGVQK